MERSSIPYNIYVRSIAIISSQYLSFLRVKRRIFELQIQYVKYTCGIISTIYIPRDRFGLLRSHYRLETQTTQIISVRVSSGGPLVSPALWSFRIASVVLYRVLCVVSMECKHPAQILGRPRRPRDDGFWSATVFSTCLKTVADHFSRRFRTTIGRP